jgi:hypothetical protein
MRVNLLLPDCAGKVDSIVSRCSGLILPPPWAREDGVLEGAAQERVYPESLQSAPNLML